MTTGGALERARDAVGRRLLGAAYREDLGRARAIPGLVADRYGFDRVAVTGPVTGSPERWLADIGTPDAGVAAELDDAIANLAVALDRRGGIDAGWRARAGAAGSPDAYGALDGTDGDERALAYERLVTEGHNLHPCGRTRLGWSPADVLAYDQEAEPFPIGFVAIRAGAHVGDDVGAWLRERYPDVPAAPPGYVVTPVHPWQLRSVLRDRYADRFADGTLRDLPGAIEAAPTTALRTVLLAPDRHGRRHYLKLSLDIQVTSTRRSISVASTRNGPAISAILTGLTAGDPTVLLMPEVAGSALAGGRDAAAIVRGGIGGRLAPGEVPVPGAALPACSPVTGRTVLAEIVDRYAAARGGADPAAGFLREYARLLLRPVLRLLAAGVGLEAHLQNCVPVFRDGVPVRIALRDFAGLRLHLPRLAAHADLELWPGSVVGTGDVDVVRAKVGYTALQAHLGEMIIQLGASHGLPEDAAWRCVREVIDEVYAHDALPAGDHAFLTAPRMPHKALLRMRLAGAGDIYVPVTNPLHHA